MKQSLKLLQHPSMPRYCDQLPSGLHFVFPKRAWLDKEPRPKTKALRAFPDLLSARQWAKNNLDDYTIASRHNWS